MRIVATARRGTASGSPDAVNGGEYSTRVFGAGSHDDQMEERRNAEAAESRGDAIMVARRKNAGRMPFLRQGKPPLPIAASGFF
jgi:hypothetical protein